MIGEFVNNQKGIKYQILMNETKQEKCNFIQPLKYFCIKFSHGPKKWGDGSKMLKFLI